MSPDSLFLPMVTGSPFPAPVQMASGGFGCALLIRSKRILFAVRKVRTPLRLSGLPTASLLGLAQREDSRRLIYPADLRKASAIFLRLRLSVGLGITMVSLSSGQMGH